MTTMPIAVDTDIQQQSQVVVLAESPDSAGQKIPYVGKFLAAVVVSLLVIAAVTYSIFTLMGFVLLPAGARLSDESLSGNISIVIGGAVAFAGSFVAVMLAGRALDLTDMQVKMTDRQVALAENANRIAARQAPEAEAAVTAAQQYARFKSMLLSMAALLRKAQRDNAFAADGEASNLQKVAREIERSTQDLLQSNVPAAVIDIADKLENSNTKNTEHIQGKRYFEYALSSLFYDLATLETALAPASPSVGSGDDRRMMLMRLLHALYSVVREVDSLVITASSSAAKDQMTEFQQLFLERVLPVAVLNRGIWLETDFASFHASVFTSKKPAGIVSAKPLSTLTWEGNDHAEGLRRGGLILALHESGHAEALAGVQRALLAQGQQAVPIFVEGYSWQDEARAVKSEQVPIFFIVGNMDKRLYEVSEFIKQCNRNAGPGARHWAQTVILLDQVDQFHATNVTSKHLTMQDVFDTWDCFKALDAVLSGIADATTHFFGYPVTTEQRLDVITEGLMASKPMMRNLIARQPQPLLARDGRAEDIDAMVLRAAQAVGHDAGADVTKWVMVCNAILEQDWQHGELDATRVESLFPPLDPDDKDYRDYTGLVETVSQLAQTPLVGRPLYQFTPAYGNFDTGLRVDLDLDGATVLGVAYLDSSFATKRTSLVDVLAGDGRVYSLF